jgi:HEAT repeat protein
VTAAEPSGAAFVSAAAPDSLAAALLATLDAPDRSERARAIDSASEAVDPDDLVRLVADHANARKRNAALEALSRGGARCRPAVIRALRHPDPEVVMFAAGVLAKSGSAAAIPHLVGLVDHEDINVAQQVIESLSELRSPLAVDALMRALDRDPWLRFAAVHALGEIGDARAVEALASLLEDQGVREAVVTALGKIGSVEALDHLLRTLRESRTSEEFSGCLRAIGEALELLPNEEARRTITGRVDLSSVAATPLRERLARVLLGEPLESELEASDHDPREAAAAIVSAFRLRALYTALVMAGRDPMLREILAHNVVAIGPEIVPHLERGLEAIHMEVRILACECLGALGHRASAPQVERLLSDPHPVVRASALGALMRLGYDAGVNRIAHLLCDPHPAVSSTAAASLGLMDVELVTKVLLEMTATARLSRLRALGIMQCNPHEDQRTFIVACLTDESSDVRRAAIEALGRQPGPYVVDALETCLGDGDPHVRRAAVAVLGSVRSARVRDILLDHVERDREALRALGDRGDTTAIPFLFEAFERESADGESRFSTPSRRCRTPRSSRSSSGSSATPTPRCAARR